MNPAAWPVRVDGLLRAGSRVDAEPRPLRAREALAIVLACGLFYGAMMGTFGFNASRSLQALFSAAKVPALLLVTFALSVPSFFVLNALFGLADDFRVALRALLSAQAALSVALASLAPFTLLFYASSSHYTGAILFNAAMFGVAGIAAQSLVRRLYRPLVARSSAHAALLRAWLLIYGFVGVQMGYVLRPFVGSPDKPVTFFREGAWDNAYVVLARMIGEMLGL